ncbi:hypothetical protein [Haladaptatus litoreus]|uniref:hypothetical protein n=1 Tax=Haladaptatus litoreus TaxID=553468 RepID=UPI001FEBE616|nr:hypothetical protein [Haladaptatus litoreus]
MENHDVYPLFGTRDALIETGETGKNVNDLRVVVVTDSEEDRESIDRTRLRDRTQ